MDGTAGRRYELALLAPEFPPMTGGMAELAGGLAAQLAAHDDVAVYTPAGGKEEAGTAMSGPVTSGTGTSMGMLRLPLLTGRTGPDGRLLRRATPVEVWLAMNAGLIPLARRLRQPFFVYLHGNDFLKPWLACGPAWFELVRRPYAARLRHALRRLVLRRTVGAVRHLLTNSHATARLITARLGVAQERIAVCPPGVDDVFFQERRPATSPALRLLTVARLTRYTARKNVDGVLQALALLGDRLAVHYTVVGDGDDLPRLRRLARDLGLGERVVFTGGVRRDELVAHYAAADLFVLAPRATHDDVEGFGIVYLEAAAAGVPVLGSHAGGAVDAIREGWNGMLLADSTPSSIAAGLERFHRIRDHFPPERVRAFAERYRWPEVARRLREEMLARL